MREFAATEAAISRLTQPNRGRGNVTQPWIGFHRANSIPTSGKPATGNAKFEQVGRGALGSFQTRGRGRLVPKITITKDTDVKTAAPMFIAVKRSQARLCNLSNRRKK